jgi:hypothetical protein
VEKVNTLHNIIEMQKRQHQPLYICYVDLNKAYDSVEIWFLMQSLRRLGFSAEMQAIIQNIYSQNNIQIITPWGITHPFQSLRGVRQGDTLSPILFNICIDPLLQAVQSAKLGIQISDEHCVGCLAYADDIALLTSSAADMQKIVQLLEQYCQHTGMSPNMDPSKRDKTVVTSFEDLPAPIWYSSQQIPFISAKEAYKYLGIWTSLAGNWEKQEAKLQTSVFAWRKLDQRLFTLEQRIIIFNRVVAPAIGYSLKFHVFHQQLLK